MENIRRKVMTIAGAVLGLWAGTALAQPFPGGLPACQANLDVCRAALTDRTSSLAACTGALSANSTSLATCSTSLDVCNTDLGACTTDSASSSANLAACSASLNTCDTSLAACTSNLNACDTTSAACTNDLSACNTALAAAAPQFPATGQKTCWDSSGAVVACDIAGTGQDGDVRAGAALSFSANGDGTITDNTTTLMWEKKSSDGGSTIHDVGAQYSWAEAFAVHIATLNATSFAGYSDWRLPNVRELQSIADYEQHSNPTVSSAFNNNCVPGVTTILTGSCTASAQYWTSTTVARDPTAALVVIFSDGLIGETFKTAARRVRAVRGGL